VDAVGEYAEPTLVRCLLPDDVHTDTTDLVLAPLDGKRELHVLLMLFNALLQKESGNVFTIILLTSSKYTAIWNECHFVDIIILEYFRELRKVNQLLPNAF